MTANANGRVTRLDLRGQRNPDTGEPVPHGLTGPIPAELGDLSELRVLFLSRNTLRESIPRELSNLARLDSLTLGGNQLVGPIPPELGSLEGLRALWLWGNNLTGSIPAELGGLASLEVLSLSDNQLAGEIPAELGGLTSLERLYLQDNDLTGSIPAELGGLTSLERLYLQDNDLTGSIPAELGGLTSLERLLLQDNNLTGSIPAELGSLASLEGLLLQDNNLTGSLPAELGGLASLEVLWLSENRLTGEIPAELGGLASLEDLYLSNNRLTGEIPAELGGLSSLIALYLNDNQLAGEIPAELGGLASLSHLLLFGNSGLAGALPLALSSLSALESFWYYGTGLCVPADESFRAWLNAIQDHEGTGLDCATTAVATVPAQTLVVGDRATSMRLEAAFIDPDGDELTYSAVTADKDVASVAMSGATLSIIPVAEGATTVNVTATDSGGLGATLAFPVTVERLAPRRHNVILRVVHVTTDWMPYAGSGGWPAAAEPKESAALKYFEAAIWDETASVHLYEFDNDFDVWHDAGTDSARIAYREQYVVRKHTGMPSDRIARQGFVKSAFMDFARYIAEQFPDSDHHLLYSGHGGPGGQLFAGHLTPEGSAEFLGTWRELLGRRLGVIDMGGPCNKGGLSDLENFCSHARYYIASDLPNGGYTMDDWTPEKWDEVKVERQYHALFQSNGTLEEALKARIDLKRQRYEYSRQDMIANRVEQANYLYSCTNMMAELGWNAQLFVEQAGGRYGYGRDLWKYLTDNDAPKPLLEMFDRTIIHQADNRDFFAWEEVANGIMLCCAY